MVRPTGQGQVADEPCRSPTSLPAIRGMTGSPVLCPFSALEASPQAVGERGRHAQGAEIRCGRSRRVRARISGRQCDVPANHGDARSQDPSVVREVQRADRALAVIDEAPASAELLIFPGEERLDGIGDGAPGVFASAARRSLRSRASRASAGRPSTTSARATASASSMSRARSLAIISAARFPPAGFRSRNQRGSGGAGGLSGAFGLAASAAAGLAAPAFAREVRPSSGFFSSRPRVSRAPARSGRPRRGHRTLATCDLDRLARGGERRERPAHERQPELVRLGRIDDHPGPGLRLDLEASVLRLPASAAEARSGSGLPSAVAMRAVSPHRLAVRRVEPDRERAVVDELDGHLGPERSGRDRDAERRERRREADIEPLGELGGGTGGEARAPATTRVGVQRELRDDERRAADLEQRQVRPAVGVTEDAQLRGFPGEVLGDRVRVLRADSKQDDQPGPISPTTAPSTSTRAPVVRWSSALTAGWAAG